jgi:hypothetical protein
MLCARGGLPPALEPPESDPVRTREFHVVAEGRSNISFNATALKRLSHVRCAGRRVNSGVRYRLGSQVVFISGSKGLPLFKTP